MIELINKNGATIYLNEIGAGIVSVIVPDRNGNLADVALGYKDTESYMGDGPCAGKIPGRFANRIAGGEFFLEGKKYNLPINNGPNHLHGGPDGFANRVWNIVPPGQWGFEPAEDESVAVFSLESAAGDAGYPGALKVKAAYHWKDSNILTLEITATSDETTVLNLTNHTYWNLSGEDSGSVLDHELTLNASNYLPTDDTLIPTGEIASVAGTPMNFLNPKALGRDIKNDFDALRYGKGYDNCWVVDGWKPVVENNAEGATIKTGKLCKVGTLADKSSGRIMEIYSTQPGVQVYTGNWLAGSPISKSGRSYNDYDGVAIECQGFPDSPNKPQFPSPILHKGEIYRHLIEFRFTNAII